MSNKCPECEMPLHEQRGDEIEYRCGSFGIVGQEVTVSEMCEVTKAYIKLTSERADKQLPKATALAILAEIHRRIEAGEMEGQHAMRYDQDQPRPSKIWPVEDFKDANLGERWGFPEAYPVLVIPIPDPAGEEENR